MWRKVCGVTLPGRPASPTAFLNPFFTDATGLPLNSTKHVAISLRSFQRRRWASNRGGMGAGFGASWWHACRSASGRRCRAQGRHKIGQARHMAMPTQSRRPGVPVYKPINMNLAICLKGRRSVRIDLPSRFRSGLFASRDNANNAKPVLPLPCVLANGRAPRPWVAGTRALHSGEGLLWRDG